MTTFTSRTTTTSLLWRTDVTEIDVRTYLISPFILIRSKETRQIVPEELTLKFLYNLLSNDMKIGNWDFIINFCNIRLL